MAQYAAKFEEDREDVGEKLIQLQIHRCDGCKKTLRRPIMTDPENGRNYCFNCKTGPKLVRNEILEDVLHTLKIPCEYEDNGCPQKVTYSVLAAHEALCTRRQFHCPLKWSQNCPWEGSLSSILDHCKANHKGKIFEASGPVTLNVKEDLQEVIVIENSIVFIVRLQQNDQKTVCKVYFVGDLDETKDFSFVIDGCDKQPHKVLPFITFNPNMDLNSSRTCTIENPSRNKIQLKISGTKSDEGFDDKFSTFFECPVCKRFMRPPIYQCLAGHSVCHSCKPQLSSCPICRVNFGSTRNYSLEAMCSGIRIPCTNQDKGCNQVFLASEMGQHEDQCSLRDFPCPLKDSNLCSWEGSLPTLARHLKEFHPNKTYSNDHRFPSTFARHKNVYEVSCIVAFGQVFRLCHRTEIGEDQSEWSVQFIGAKKDAKKFEYKIVLVDERDESKITMKSSSCHKVTNKYQTFDECISIPNKVVSWFANNDQIVYFCKIRQLAT